LHKKCRLNRMAAQHRPKNLGDSQGGKVDLFSNWDIGQGKYGSEKNQTKARYRLQHLAEVRTQSKRRKITAGH